MIENNPYDRRFKFPKWNGTVTVLQEHRLFNRLPEFQTWTKAQHHREALYAIQSARILRTAYYDLVAQAESIYGDHGQLISGVIRDHFPDTVKDTLRSLCRQISRESDRSLAHWYAARKAFHTWIALRDSLYPEKTY
jgi:hypothetical protein